MTDVSGHDLVKTHFCTVAGCTNEARSDRGLYSKCDEHRKTNVGRTAMSRANESANGNSHSNGGGDAEKHLRDLLTLAKRVDKAKAKADRMRVAANQADRLADDLEAEYREKVAAAARGLL